MPKERGKIHPLLAPVLANGAVEEGVGTGETLVEQSYEIVFQRNLVLRVQTVLPVEYF